jgi:hypothetical protein
MARHCSQIKAAQARVRDPGHLGASCGPGSQPSDRRPRIRPAVRFNQLPGCLFRMEKKTPASFLGYRGLRLVGMGCPRDHSPAGDFTIERATISESSRERPQTVVWDLRRAQPGVSSRGGCHAAKTARPVDSTIERKKWLRLLDSGRPISSHAIPPRGLPYLARVLINAQMSATRFERLPRAGGLVGSEPAISIPFCCALNAREAR